MNKFDAVSHTYSIDGEIVPSVSQIIAQATSKQFDSVDPVILANAARRGTEVHRTIEFYERAGISETDDEMQPYLTNYIEFKCESGLVVLEQEVVLYDKEAGFAGTLDMFVEGKGNEIGIVDIKTPKSMSKRKWAIQLAGYKRLAEANGYGVCSVAFLHLTDERCKLFEIEPELLEEATRVFDGLLLAYKYVNKKTKRGKKDGI